MSELELPPKHAIRVKDEAKTATTHRRMTFVVLLVRIGLILIVFYLFDAFMRGAAIVTLAQGQGVVLSIAIKFDGFGYGMRPAPQPDNNAVRNRSEQEAAFKRVNDALYWRYRTEEGPGTFLFGLGSRVGIFGAGLIGLFLFAGLWWWKLGPRIGLAPMLLIMLGIGIWIGIAVGLRRGHDSFGEWNGWVLVGTFAAAAWLAKRSAVNGVKKGA